MTLFDERGRRIPAGITSMVCKPNYNFSFVQPEIDYEERLEGLKKLGAETDITTKEFKENADYLTEQIRKNPDVSNILNGVHFPIIMPGIEEAGDDPGSLIEHYLKFAEKSSYPFGNKFHNSLEGILLKGRVLLISSNCCRKEVLKGRSVLIHFPACLQGFSIKASREQIKDLSEGFVLWGPDTIIALAMYPEILAKEYNTPGLDLAGLYCKGGDGSVISTGDCLNIKAFRGSVVFGLIPNSALNIAHPYYAGSLSFAGSD